MVKKYTVLASVQTHLEYMDTFIRDSHAITVSVSSQFNYICDIIAIALFILLYLHLIDLNIEELNIKELDINFGK